MSIFDDVNNWEKGEGAKIIQNIAVIVVIIIGTGIVLCFQIRQNTIYGELQRTRIILKPWKSPKTGHFIF